jgi:hypothetical protein
VYDTEFELATLSTPQAIPVQPFPDKLHVTPLFVVSFWTLAVNIRVWDVGTFADVGDIETERGAGLRPTLLMLPPPQAVMISHSEPNRITDAIRCMMAPRPLDWNRDVGRADYSQPGTLFNLFNPRSQRRTTVFVNAEQFVESNYWWFAENVPLTPWQTGVFELHDPVPVIEPLPTVPLASPSTKLPLLSPATKIRLNAVPAATGLDCTPIKIPCCVFFVASVDSPVPEIDPCPLLLLAIKQTGPCTENVPTGVVTLHGLETNVTW